MTKDDSVLSPGTRAGEAVRVDDPWAEARRMIDGWQGGINIAHEALDRHVEAGYGGQLAIRWLGKSGERRDLTYSDLQDAANRFAQVLGHHGLKPGDSVFAMAGRVPELYATALGTLKAGMIFTPLFSAFGPDPVRTRMEIGGATALVTTESIYRRKIASWAHEIDTLKLILIIGDTAPEGCVALGPAMDAASPRFETVATAPEDPALIHFTSGTTGKPKGAVHVHNAVLYHAYSGRMALGLGPGVKYWCTADPGWVTGTSYGIISPLVNRVSMLIDEAEFDLERWYSTVQDEKVEVWYSAPTAIRMMMREGADVAKGYDFSSLGFLASVGEPLNPEAVVWSEKVFGQPFHDNWWQTETGGIMIANRPGMEVRPGSMGQPLPGIEAGHRREDGRWAEGAWKRRDRGACAAPRLAVDDADLPP
jgi:acetyl-CoA synthetase